MCARVQARARTAEGAYVAIVFYPLQSVITDQADLNTMKGTLKKQYSNQMFVGAGSIRIANIGIHFHWLIARFRGSVAS